MDVFFEYQSARFTDALAALRDYTGRETRAFVTEQFRLLIEQIMKFTPPNNVSQGLKRVKADINKVFSPWKITADTPPRVREIIRAGDVPAFESFLRSIKKSQAVQRFDPAVHQRLRDRRGRIGRGKRPAIVIGRDDERALAAYVRHKQENVGQARSGWLAALLRVGGVPPSWVLRHTSDRGEVIDQRDAPQPFMEAVNKTAWANRRDEGERIIRLAMQSRAYKLERALVVAIRLSARKSGFSVAA